MKSVIKNKNSWYVAGLHFECQQCGNCCSGPDEGYIWVTKPEIKLIADFLKIQQGQLRQKYLKRVSFRTTIIEQPATKDCIFLQKIDGHRFDKLTIKKRCVIYPVRPNQCRIWPFWSENLAGEDAWNKATQKCPGINHGKCYSFEEIEKIRKQKWWLDGKQQSASERSS